MNPYETNGILKTLSGRLSRRAAVARIAGAGAAAAAAGLASNPSRAAAATTLGASMSQATPTADSTEPTVLLVHGAFADASSWAGVVTGLQADGIKVQAPANPLRSVSGDAAYVASVANQIAGPILLVGHSYGGAVISNAAPMVGNAVGLVYVAAFIPDEGESLQALAEQATDSLLGAALRPAQFPAGEGDEPGVELYIDPALFHEAFAADLPVEQAAVMAASQRPASAAGFGEPSGPVGWRDLPSWAVVPTADYAIGPTGVRAMAERAGSIVVEVDASHVVMISQPAVVTDLIRTALGTIG